jgi:hypothetical protein
MTKPRFNLTLEATAAPDRATAVRRLRAALKRMLRSYGLRCVHVEPADLRTPNPEGEYSYPLESSHEPEHQIGAVQ